MVSISVSSSTFSRYSAKLAVSAAQSPLRATLSHLSKPACGLSKPVERKAWCSPALAVLVCKNSYLKVPGGSCKTCIRMLHGNRARDVGNKMQKDFHRLCFDCIDSTKVIMRTEGDTASEDGNRSTNGLLG